MKNKSSDSMISKLESDPQKVTSLYSPDPNDPFAASEELTFFSDVGNAYLKEFRKLIKRRKKYGNKILCYIRYWLIFIGAIIVIDGITSIFHHIFLSGEVLITLLTTTTVNVLGLAYLVIKFTFKDYNFPTIPETLLSKDNHP